MKNSITSALKSLPPLSESIIHIQKMCANPDSSLQDISHIVEKDPMLTANILKAANSPLYGFSHEVTNVAQAVSLFGMATILGFAVSSAIKNAVKIDMDPYRITEENFAKLTIMQNALMSAWMDYVDRSRLSILSPAAFLNETGKVVIAMVLKTTGKADAFKKALDEHSVTEAEQAVAETTSAEVAADLFALWKFDPKIVETIRFCTHPSSAPEGIKALSEALYVIKEAITLNGSITPQTRENALKMAEAFGLNTAILAAEIDKISERMGA